MLSTGTDIGDLIFQIRNASNAPGSKGPIVRTAWRGIAPPDAGPFPPMRAAPFGVKTEAEARADVRELAARKVDFVKIWVDDRNGTLPKLSPAIYKAIIDEAHKNGLRVIAHVVTLADVKDLLRAGIDGFAHLFRDHEADAEVIALLKARPNVFFMLTLWAPRLAAATERPCVAGRSARCAKARRWIRFVSSASRSRAGRRSRSQARARSGATCRGTSPRSAKPA